MRFACSRIDQSFLLWYLCGIMLPKGGDKPVWDIKEKASFPEVTLGIFVGPTPPASSQRSSLSHSAESFCFTLSRFALRRLEMCQTLVVPQSLLCFHWLGQWRSNPLLKWGWFAKTPSNSALVFKPLQSFRRWRVGLNEYLWSCFFRTSFSRKCFPTIYFCFNCTGMPVTS